MKKLSLLVVAILSTTSIFAQTTLWDGENFDLGSKGGCWDDGNPTVVSNPETDGINSSAKCLTLTMTNNNKVVKIPFRDWIQPNLNGRRRISLMIKKSTNENSMVEISDPTDGSAGYWEKVATWYGGDGKWQKIVFDFSTNHINDFPGVFSITAQTSDVSGDEIVYIDNVVAEELPMVNGKALNSIPDGSLTGTVTLTGSWMKGDCQYANGDWITVNYNDYALLATKLSQDATIIDFRNAQINNFYNPFTMVNPHIQILTSDKSTTISSLMCDREKYVDVYDMKGALVKKHILNSTAISNLPKGIYLISGKKIAIE